MTLLREQSALIREYFSERAMAVIGASNAKDKFGNLACRELKARGFRIFPVNPDASEICGERCYHTVDELGARTDRMLIILPPDMTHHLISTLDSGSVSHVWMQNGSESSEAIQECQAKGIRTIYRQCILMHAQPVRSYHLLHRWWRMNVSGNHSSRR
jgi:uncharacterized protein